MPDEATTHLANCPVARNEPGACLGCADIMGVPVPLRPTRIRNDRKKKAPKSAYERAQNANYMRDRRQRPKRIAGEDFRYDSVDHLPPIEIDANGFAKKPPTPPEAWKYNFTLEQRKVRFLLMWNFAGGNWTMACQHAGVSRKIAEEWLRDDERIKPLLQRAREEIADRMRLRLFQVAGLVPTPKAIVVHNSTLLGLVKGYGIELPDVETPPAAPPAAEASDAAPAVGGIPRPGAAAAVLRHETGL